MLFCAHPANIHHLWDVLHNPIIHERPYAYKGGWVDVISTIDGFWGWGWDRDLYGGGCWWWCDMRWEWDEAEEVNIFFLQRGLCQCLSVQPPPPPLVTYRNSSQVRLHLSTDEVLRIQIRKPPAAPFLNRHGDQISSCQVRLSDEEIALAGTNDLSMDRRKWGITDEELLICWREWAEVGTWMRGFLGSLGALNARVRVRSLNLVWLVEF